MGHSNSISEVAASAMTVTVSLIDPLSEGEEALIQQAMIPHHCKVLEINIKLKSSEKQIAESLIMRFISHPHNLRSHIRCVNTPF